MRPAPIWSAFDVFTVTLPLVEKAPDADLLREMIGFAAQGLMELEVAGLTGAAYGDKSAERPGAAQRLSGPDLGDPTGAVELRIQSYFPGFLGRAGWADQLGKNPRLLRLMGIVIPEGTGYLGTLMSEKKNELSTYCTGLGRSCFALGGKLQSFEPL